MKKFNIGSFVIVESEGYHGIYSLYQITLDGKELGRQITLPSASDCLAVVTGERSWLPPVMRKKSRPTPKHPHIYTAEEREAIKSLAPLLSEDESRRAAQLVKA